ncbi:9415_t:CDS:10, partial [Entrophospora sp. SA101]
MFIIQIKSDLDIVKNGNSIIHFDSIEEALKDFAEGKFVLVVDNEERENEGDLIIAAEKVTAEKMAFMIKYTSGLICVPTSPERLDQLEIPLMVPNNNTEKLKTAYTISVDYKHNTTTGISAHDRALTARCLANPVITNPNDFNRPGHIFPLRYTPGGVLKRIGHTEASIDLCKLARLQPVGVICELVKDDGSMARRDDCRLFADEHDLKLITIDDLIKYLVFIWIFLDIEINLLVCFIIIKILELLRYAFNGSGIIDDNDESLTKTELKAQTGKTWGRDKDITYITVLCSAIIIICCPILVTLFWTICTHYQCSFYEPFHLFVMIVFSKESFNDYFLQKLPSFSCEGLQIYFGWLIFQGLLYAFLPVKIGYGQQTPAGHILPYKVNGLLAWVITHLIFIFGAFYFELWEASIIHDKWGELFVAANIYGMKNHLYESWYNDGVMKLKKSMIESRIEQKNSEITIIKEKLAAGKVAKDKGNEFFKEGKVKEVTKDFGIFRKDLQEDDDQTKKNPLQEDIKKTTSIIYSNLAAIEYTQKALKNDPDNIKALYRRAQAYIGDGNTDKAREDLNKLTEKDPN